MRVAVAAGWDGEGWLQALADDGRADGPVEHVPDVVAVIGEREKQDHPRWVWADTRDLAAALLRAGVRVGRSHDVALAEAILLGYEHRWGEPRSLAAAWARLRGLTVPADIPPTSREVQPALFDSASTVFPRGDEAIEALTTVHADQQRRIDRADHPLGLLVAADSAGALAAAEMAADGLPWRADVHEALLAELLGPRPVGGGRPRRLQELTDRIAAAFGRAVNPDSPAQVVRAFTAAGVRVESTRSRVLRRVEHPAAELLLGYKELARLHAAHGWAWLDAWVHDGRFRPEYVVAGVVSGRWATRGGGALQIPRAVRRAVVADPGWVLVVADAAQLEPRVLAALADDRALAAAGAASDLYAGVAEALGGERHRAKIALLSAIYGGTAGEAGQLLGVLRRQFPPAVGYVEAAARAGEEGRLVRSRLGRTSPPPSAYWPAAEFEPGADDNGGQVVGDDNRDRAASRAARERGRFTRNFVVQASAADWAAVMLAALRRRLAGLTDDPARRPQLVFFQHDEVIVHCPRERAADVAAAAGEAGEEARRLVFGDTPVRFPLDVAVVDCYADAKPFA